MRRAALLLLIVAGCQRSGERKIALRYHPPTGAVYHHTFELHGRVTAPPGLFGGRTGRSQETNMRMYSTQTVKGPVADGVELEIVADSASMTQPTVSADTLSRYLSEVRGLRNTIVFDDRSQVVRSALTSDPAPGLASQLAYTLQAASFSFPEQPLGRGDSWTIKAVLPFREFLANAVSGPDSAETTLTVREIRIHGGDTVVVLDVKTAYPTTPLRVLLAGLRASIKFSGDNGGYQEFSITRGTVIAAEVHNATTILVTVPTLSLRDDAVKADSRTTIRLVGMP
ncbi:MAG TPA: hypothetical protein VKD28_11410 [Gemmatimonadales bacterium]|nr:hypothetical protein [Gemmatimonadales bacterium]